METYRKVQIASLVPTSPPKPPATLQNSNLVTVTLTDTPTAYPAAGSHPLGYTSATAPQPGLSVISPVDFGPVFQEYASLDKVPIFNLLATPGITDNLVTSEAVAYCERKRAFYIMDTPSSETTGWDVNQHRRRPDQSTPLSPSAAHQHQRRGLLPVAADDRPGDREHDRPGHRETDSWRRQADTWPGSTARRTARKGSGSPRPGIQTTLLGTTGVDTNGMMTDPQQGVLNLNAINCLRQFPGIGTVVFGARTTAATNPAYQQWKYVAVRRMALFIEQTLYANLTWAVFEGNSTPLWNALTQEVTAFMLSLFRQGAFAGDTPKTAFLVQCDSTTTTQQDIDNGVVNIVVGFAPLLPAEFVVVKIAQLAGQTQS